VKHFAVVCFFITYEVKEWNESFASHFVDEFTFPEEHDMSLHFDSFFLYKILGK